MGGSQIPAAARRSDWKLEMKERLEREAMELMLVGRIQLDQFTATVRDPRLVHVMRCTRVTLLYHSRHKLYSSVTR